MIRAILITCTGLLIVSCENQEEKRVSQSYTLSDNIVPLNKSTELALT